MGVDAGTGDGTRFWFTLRVPGHPAIPEPIDEQRA
jgi:hypothetical protein